jgi:hypothetical protein
MGNIQTVPEGGKTFATTDQIVTIAPDNLNKLNNIPSNFNGNQVITNISDLQSRPTLPPGFNANQVLTNITNLQNSDTDQNTKIQALQSRPVFIPGDYTKTSDLKNVGMWCANGVCVLPSDVKSVAIGNNMVLRDNPIFPNDVCVIADGKPIMCIDKTTNTIPVNSAQRFPVPWIANKAYKVGDHVTYVSNTFRALTNHTSSTTVTPPTGTLSNANWTRTTTSTSP